MLTDSSTRTAPSKRNRTVATACWILGAIAVIEIILAAIALAPRVAVGIRNGQHTQSSPANIGGAFNPDSALATATQSGSQPTLAPVQEVQQGVETERPVNLKPNPSGTGVAAAPLHILYAKFEPSEDGSSKVLRVAIKSNSREKIEVPQVKVQVYFYDEDESGEIVPSKAQVTSRWLSAPVDWLEGTPEILEVRYLSDSAEPGLRFAGYVVAVYYRGDRDDCRSEPSALMKKFPPKYFIGLDEQ